MKTYLETMLEAERTYLSALMVECNGSAAKAVKIAGIRRGTIYKLLWRSGVRLKDGERSYRTLRGLSNTLDSLEEARRV